MPQNSLGPLNFLRLDGPLAAPRRSFVVEARPGVDGVALWATGRRGQPLRVETACDYATLATCETAFRAYEALLDGAAYPLVWQGITAPFRVYVLDVERLDARGLLLALGGLNHGRGLLRAAWTLLPQDIS